MWRFVLFVSTIGSWAEAQLGRAQTSEHTNSHGWDIRLAVPGEPGNDYPTLSFIPRTTFSCAGKEPGYYADLETGCQVFRICTVGSTYGFQSFLCPNGTLFNQDVFVCDWWMHVKCQSFQRLKAPTEKFSNLRLGPQLMKDVKKMLTHPMRNSYDKTAMKGNLIVMQDYKPPAGQLFPNEALIAGPERPPNNIYIPAKQIQQNFQGLSNDIAFAASTPETRYIPAGFTNRPTNSEAEVFQRQRQLNDQYRQVQTTQLSEIGNIISNGHTVQYSQKGNNGQQENIPQTRPNQNLNQINSQYSQNRYNEQVNDIQQLRQNQNYNQANSQYTQIRNNDQTNSIQRPNQNSNIGQYTQNQRSNVANSQTSFIQNTPRGQFNRARAQYTDGTKSLPYNDVRQNDVVSYSKQNIQEKRPYTYRPPIPPLPEELNAPIINNNFKQNLVSDVPPTVITKTLTFSKILQEPKPGRPKSRVTVKTWIAKPKSARLIAEPSSYVYTKPTQPPTERLIAKTEPYVYSRSTTTAPPPQPARLIQEESPKPYNYPPPTTSRPKSQRVVEDFSSDPQPYVYNRPTPPPTTPKAEKIEDDEPVPYFYNRPTIASRQILTPRSEPPRGYLPPTAARPRPTVPAQLNLPTSPPTTPSKPNPPPTTFKPAARLYLPPESPQPVRQYLTPTALQPYQSAQLRATPTTPTTSSPTLNEKPSYTVVKQSRINASRNNLTFTDILTKEKLDITVNDIVRDTGKILQTAPPPKFGQYREDVKSVDYPNENYLPTELDESDEKLTSQVPTATTPSKSARLIAQPARNLEPPVESAMDISSNKLADLPFLKESLLPNTIERTVSLKITIPERLASYLLRGNDTDFNQLEVLNTGSSNYIVLSNQNTGSSIPIKNSNVSNSQALVFSFLADSLNAAKEYSNIVKQDALLSTTTPAPAQLRNLNNEDLSHIANRVSQLTSSQFSGNNDFKSVNLPAPQTTISTTPQQNSLEDQTQQTLAQYNAPSRSSQTQGQRAQYRISDLILNSNSLETNPNEIYSGQLYKLPVPEVTNQIYNRPQSSNFIQTKSKQQTQTATPQADNNVANHNNLAKQSSEELETVPSQTLPPSPAKLQLAPNNEPESFYSQESLNNIINDNGISAQVQDKIVGTIPHPLEDNKLLTYEKDQSYYLFTKFDNGQNVPVNAVVKASNIPSVITFQLVPSVSYQLEDAKEQQKLLNQFQIDEFGAPRGVMRANLVQDPSQQPKTLTSSVDYSIEHPKSPKQVRLEPITALYQGPSSYLAPQGSVGSLPRQTLLPSSRLEQLNENFEGYPKTIPVRRFVF